MIWLKPISELRLPLYSPLFFSVRTNHSAYTLCQQMEPQGCEIITLSMRISASILTPVISSATFLPSLPYQNKILTNIQVLLR
jgi:hypothetical protein